MPCFDRNPTNFPKGRKIRSGQGANPDPGQGPEAGQEVVQDQDLQNDTGKGKNYILLHCFIDIADALNISQRPLRAALENFTFHHVQFLLTADFVKALTKKKRGA